VETLVSDLRLSPDEEEEIERNGRTGQGMQRYVFLVTRTAWNTQVAPKGIGKIRSAHNYRDEFHKEPNATTNTVTFMKGLGGKPFNTWFSGTTAEEPKDLLGFCEVAWKSCGSAANAHKLWSKFDHDGLKKLDGLIKSRNKDVQDRSLTTWSTFKSHVCIQRTRMSTWNGEVIYGNAEGPRENPTNRRLA
jgi:hypothetical protein